MILSLWKNIDVMRLSHYKLFLSISTYRIVSMAASVWSANFVEGMGVDQVAIKSIMLVPQL
jgi:hypothetical protein